MNDVTEQWYLVNGVQVSTWMTPTPTPYKDTTGTRRQQRHRGTSSWSGAAHLSAAFPGKIISSHLVCTTSDWAVIFVTCIVTDVIVPNKLMTVMCVLITPNIIYDNMEYIILPITQEKLLYDVISTMV